MKRLVAIIGLNLWNLTVIPALAETLGDESRGSTAEADEWLRTASDLNRPTMADAAGSHGSYGTEIGLGFSRLSTNPDNRIVSEETGNDYAGTSSNAVDLPRIWISKGTMLPLDFTVTGGSTRDRKFSTAGAIAQATLFEALGLPALSVRGYAARTLGQTRTALETRGAEVAISMGFLRYCRAYVTTGRVWNYAQMSVEPASRASLLLQDNVKDGHYEKNWEDLTRTVGLKVTVIPGRLSVSAETSGFNTQRDAFSMRLTTNL